MTPTQRRLMFAATALPVMVFAIPNEPATVVPGSPDATVVFHGYTGQTTLIGTISKNGFHYTNGALYLDMYDSLADGIFRNGFETP